MSKLLKNLCLICILFILILNLTSCSLPAEEQAPVSTVSTDTPSADPTPPPLPNYLILVKPTGSLSSDEYDKSRKLSKIDSRGIVVGLLAERKDLSSLLSMVAIYIDDKKLTNQDVIVQDGLMPYGPFIISWSPNLSLGLHEAKFQFTNGSGKIMKYVWDFVITKTK